MAPLSILNLLSHGNSMVEYAKNLAAAEFGYADEEADEALAIAA